MKKTLPLIFLMLFSLQAFGYGESYLAEEREISLEGLSLSARMGNDLSNPYLDTFSGHLGLHYFFSERIGVQAFFQQSWSERSSLNDNIEEEFEMNGLSTRNRKPRETYRAGLELTPLFGKLNFSHRQRGTGVR
ncbi:MAG: hypothetical protein AAF202_08760 [Pseudomonadota bacterium]